VTSAWHGNEACLECYAGGADRREGPVIVLQANLASGAFGAYGTVLIVPLDDLPDWLPAWCLDHLGGEPSDVLFQLQQISMVSVVFGLRLAGGTDVVAKARADDGRAVPCVAAQARLAGRGFPCARPLTPVAGVGSLAVHAEEFRPGGGVLHGDSPDVAACYAEVFARLMAELAGVTVAPPLPNPPWVRWDHTDSGVWPAIDFLDNRDQSVVPAYVVDTAERARRRPAVRAGLRRLRGAEPPVARSAGAGGARLGQPGVATAGGAGGSGEWVFRQCRAAHAGADRKLRGVPGGLSGHSGALVHGRGAGDRVGGQLVDGSVQRPRGSTARPQRGVRRCAPGTSSRTPPPG